MQDICKGASSAIDTNDRPTIAEVNLAALASNYVALKRVVENCQVMAVIKADAYGHGAVEVARTLTREGCRHFGVATIGEGRELREAGFDQRLYLMGGFFAEQAREIVALNLTPFLNDAATIAPMAAACLTLGQSRFRVHLKIDTGAARLGVPLSELAGAIEELKLNPSLEIEGVASLLANASEPTSEVTGRQLDTFKQALNDLKAAGIVPKFAHIANSAAAVLRADSTFNMVRLGLALYGLPPVRTVADLVALRPVMTFKTRLMQRKHVPAGAGVSYGHTFIAQRPTIVGILPVGYADGYRRSLQHGGEVLIRGRRGPVIGAVCMDLTMIDLTDIPQAVVGDEVILWGGSGEAMISVNDVARLAHTISYEMVCTVGRRVRRTYRS